MTHKRVEYVDGLRGVAVVAMFFVHAAVAWLSPELRGGSYWSWSMAVSGMVAPTFLFLAGLSMAIVAERDRAAGVGPRESRKRIVKRGAEIIALGYALHFTFWALDGFDATWMRVFKVDVLHCIGLSMIVFAALAWPSRNANLRSGAAFLLLPTLAWVAYRLPLERWLPPGVSSYLTTRNALALFPFVPYGAWVTLGLFVAPSWLASAGDPRKESRFGFGLVAAGAGLLLGGEGLGRLFYASGLDAVFLDRSVDPGQSKGLLHLFWIKGAYVFFLFAAAVFTRDLWRRRAASPLVLFGKRSLFAYCVHLVLIYPVAGPYLAGRLLPSQHVALSAALTLVMFGLVVVSARRDARRPSAVSSSARWLDGEPDPFGEEQDAERSA